MLFKINIDPDAEEQIVATVHTPSPLLSQIEALIQQYNGIDRLPAYSDEEMRLLPFSQIECITVSDSKTYAYDTKGQKYRLRLRLYELEEMLPSSFIRINKSALANEQYLVRFQVGFGGSVDAVFHCGYTEYVSRRCLAAIKRRYKI